MLHQAYCFSLSIILSGILQSWFRHAFVSHLFEIRIWACIAFEAESCTKVAFALRIWIPQMFFASLVQNLIKFYHNRFKFYILLYIYHKIYWHCTRFTTLLNDRNGNWTVLINHRVHRILHELITLRYHALTESQSRNSIWLHTSKCVK